LGSGRIDAKDIKNINLIGTAMNVIEIACSPNLMRDIYLVKNAINALKKYHNFIISSNPFEHFISIFDSTFEPNDEYTLDLLAAFKIFEGIDNFNDISQDGWDNVKSKISKIEFNKQYFSKVVNDILNQKNSSGLAPGSFIRDFVFNRGSYSYLQNFKNT